MKRISSLVAASLLCTLSAPAQESQETVEAERAVPRALARPQINLQRIQTNQLRRVGEALDSAAPLKLDLGEIRRQVGDISSMTLIAADSLAAAGVETAANVELRRGEYFSVNSDQPAWKEQLPSGLEIDVVPTSIFTVGSGGALQQLEIGHWHKNLEWERGTSRYSGELLIGVFDSGDRGMAEPLAKPIAVQLLPDSGSASPNDLTIEQIGLPFKRIAISVESPADPFQVKILTQLSSDLKPAILGVVRPGLSISVSPDSINGWGLQNADVTITSTDGQLRPGDTVALQLDQGELANNALVVGDDGTAATTLRSDGTGAGTVSLVSGRFTAEPQEIVYRFPLALIISTIVGSVLGSILWIYIFLKKSKTRRLGDWTAGLICGFGVTAMVYAGVDLRELLPLPAELEGWAPPLAVSFVGAILGVPLFEGLASKLGKKPAAA